MENIQPKSTEDDSQRKGRLKLIGIFVLFVLMALSFAGSGFLMRDSLQTKAGNFLVEVTNQSKTKLRADVIVESNLVTLEMDPGEHGKVRFQKEHEGPVVLRVFRRLDKTLEIEAGDFPSAKPNFVAFQILDETNVAVSYSEGDSDDK